jgi:hypothetical protein
VIARTVTALQVGEGIAPMPPRHFAPAGWRQHDASCAGRNGRVGLGLLQARRIDDLVLDPDLEGLAGN